MTNPVEQFERKAARWRAQQPFYGLDTTGMPEDLAGAERNVFRRLSPRRDRWPEVRAFDARVVELEQRRAQVSAEVEQLRQRLQAAPQTDAERLAAWELDGRKGPRPEPQAEAIDADIRQRHADVGGLTLAITKVLEEKASFVEKHRARLVKDADRAVTEAHARLHRLLDQLAAARDELVEHRHDAVWAALYPDGAAGVESPMHHILAGGLRRPIEQALGVTTQLQAGRVIDALKADADWLKDAATPEQRALLEGNDPRQPKGAVWTDTPEGRQQDRAEKDAALRRHEELWGTRPA